MRSTVTVVRRKVLAISRDNHLPHPHSAHIRRDYAAENESLPGQAPRCSHEPHPEERPPASVGEPMFHVKHGGRTSKKKQRLRQTRTCTHDTKRALRAFRATSERIPLPAPTGDTAP